MAIYYDKIYDSTAYSIEQATLAEDLKFSELKPLDGKFYLKVLTPLVSSNEVSVKQKSRLTSANYITLTIPTYLLFQFMNVETKTIKIPTKIDTETGYPTKYENYNVICTKTSSNYVIPKGTIFFVEFLGGQAEADKAFIIGISPFKFVEG
jgi:hypothetical protein